MTATALPARSGVGAATPRATRAGRAGRRLARPGRARRASLVALVVGSAAALAAAAGPAWLVRGGAVVAVGLAALACLLSFRELAAAEHRHAAELRTRWAAALEQARADRARNAAVVAALTTRLAAADAELRLARAETTRARRPRPVEVLDPRMVELARALPNYEHERRPA